MLLSSPVACSGVLSRRKHRRNVSKRSALSFHGQHRKSCWQLFCRESERGVVMSERAMATTFSASFGQMVSRMRVAPDQKLCDYPGVTRIARFFSSARFESLVPPFVPPSVLEFAHRSTTVRSAPHLRGFSAGPHFRHRRLQTALESERAKRRSPKKDRRKSFLDWQRTYLPMTYLPGLRHGLLYK